MEYHRAPFLITTDPARVDVDAVHAYLTRSYWAEGIPREIVARAIQHSLCFSVYTGEQQIGFARVITDRATYAYLADVYILEDYRGQGLGKWLMSCIMAYPDLQGLRRWSLATRDAHGLYQQYGFTALHAPDRHMEIGRQNFYKTMGNADNAEKS